MFKSIPLGACLVCLSALTGAGSMPARAAGFSVPVPLSERTESRVVSPSTNNLLGNIGALAATHELPSTDSSLTVATSLLGKIWSGEIDSEGEKHDSVKPSHHHEGDDEGEGEEHDPPAPTPEPSTILTFGTALAIGGGVFLLGRLRKERK
jgi:hypothetical protein